MPVIFCYEGFRFFFFSNEGMPPEPAHAHVRQGGASAKLNDPRRLYELSRGGHKL